MLLFMTLKVLFILDFSIGTVNLNNEINKELMPATWHPTRWWDWYMIEDEKKEIELFFIDQK